ncbi:alginate lyase family protein [Paenibacillus roseipurpureus]|uniref:Alginate lyase family protein n=1 Tax=Paenibacillus roseopurpureus TaxID=2918901 RepID=A0AA96LQK2_9BACL|nr:alginate lyase family protein [Paenibacillus sp. MBLB1832]WNR45344.1 alginate lyase family protein [Paenibacillus sp. MBLB1832]
MNFYRTNEQLREAADVFHIYFSERMQQVIETAEYARRGQFKLPYTMASEEWIDHGVNVDWLYNPTEDLEYTWILNRHWHLRELGIAYLVTDDDRYVQTYQAHIRSWLKQNPVPIGISYGDAVYFQRPGPWRLLEVGLRVQSWIWGYMLMCHSAALEEAFVQEMKASLAVQASYLSHYLGDTSINHATMHMQGLYMIGTFLADHPDAPYWRQLARERLQLCMHDQIRADGIQEELTPHYHTASLDMFGTPYWLAKQTGRPFSRRYEESLGSMLTFSLATIRPDGTSIPLSDSDSTTHVLAKVGFISAVLGDDTIMRQVEASEELLWMMGIEVFLRWVAKNQEEGGLTSATAQSARLATVSFPETGYYVMRDAQHYVFVDAAPLGGAHGHADALHAEWMVRGQLIFGDSGRYTYQEGEWRRYFKGTSAHNTVTVDGQDQTPYLSTQKWGEPEAEVELHRWQTGDDFDFIDASHNGYQRLSEPVRHRRWLLFGKKFPLLVIVDWLDGEGEHLAEQTFHLAAGARIEAGSRLESEMTVQSGEEQVRLIWASTGNCDASGSLTVKQGWRSHNYGTKEEVPVLAYRLNFTDRAAIITVCLPADEASQAVQLYVTQLEVRHEKRAVEVHFAQAMSEETTTILYLDEEKVDLRAAN